MKALTMCQPWATALVSGQKKYTTRSWAPSYRGPIAIHAGESAAWCPSGTVLPLGVVLGIGVLVDCRRITPVFQHLLAAEELSWGDFSLGHYAWEILDIRAFQHPIPTLGQRRIWEWQPPAGALSQHCTQCQYPLRCGACDNPACPQDKSAAQQHLIAQANAARPRQTVYEAQWQANMPVHRP